VSEIEDIFAAESPIPIAYLSAHPTGSRYTVMPAVLNTDDDWLVLVEDLDDANAKLEAAGWVPCLGTSDPYELEVQMGLRFRAWRSGAMNLIVSDDRTYYLRSVAATLLCAKLNVRNKDERIALFREIKMGDCCGIGAPQFQAYTGPLP